MHFFNVQDGLSIGQPWEDARSAIRLDKERRQRSHHNAQIPTENKRQKLKVYNDV